MYECPHCGADDQIEFERTIRFRLIQSDDGVEAEPTDEDADLNISGSAGFCMACRHKAPMDDFLIDDDSGDDDVDETLEEEFKET